MIIMAFTGVKGSGKTTASGFLKELCPKVTEITLAKRLKDAASLALNVDRNSMDDPKVKEKEMPEPVYLDEVNVRKIFDFFQVTPDYDKHIRPHIGKVLHTFRQVGQYVGTEILRNFDEDIHCKGACIDVKQDGIYVVTDMRFIGEYDYFKRNYTDSFHPFYIQNHLAEVKIDNHPSERQVLEVAKLCQKVTNNGTMDDLKRRISEIYNKTVKGI